MTLAARQPFADDGSAERFALATLDAMHGATLQAIEALAADDLPRFRRLLRDRESLRARAGTLLDSAPLSGPGAAPPRRRKLLRSLQRLQAADALLARDVGRRHADVAGELDRLGRQGTAPPPYQPEARAVGRRLDLTR